MAEKEASAARKEPITPVARPRVRGLDLLRDPLLNKGLAFTLEERQILGVHGLMPPAQLNQEQQVYAVMENFHRWQNDLDRYIYLMALQDRNEKLFYKVVSENVELMMPVIYTPTVGLACLKYGLIYRKPRGLYITIKDKGHVSDVLSNWVIDEVKAIVVTDGERILGLGDLGCYGMGIPVGKLSLYTGLAGIKPHQCLPIMLDVGTNNETLLKDPLYIGLRQKRESGPKYDEFIDEFMTAVVGRYGPSTLIQFEDFGNHNAFRLLEKYRRGYCTFNDDIQGTAAVAVAGILASLKITKKSLRQNVFLFQGAGEASIGIAKLLVMAMKESRMSEAEALGKIWMVDSRGLIVKNRPSGGVTGEKVMFAQDAKPIDKLGDVVKQIKPTAIIGAAAVPGAFNEQVLKDMAANHERPIIFALSNPTSKAECTAEQAYQHTEGRCVFASGSPFKEVTYGGKKYSPGQGNNAYVFPGVALAVIASDIRVITDEIFLESAKLLADMVTEENLAEGRVYPPLSNILEVSTKMAVRLLEFAYKNKDAHLHPEPADKEAYIRSLQYNTDYDSFIPPMYSWPESNM
ncbi:NADP-dependent malic enzyme-like [Mizuhopecten yessoensis]|uniref:Malic enzyme n=1 Tax=Mizuhopecten yessoensis TaxID=6573 RepID=A0A210QPG1_MIZYE|nr:NADP-dependent malic enzyme-like [Mizuhopecten yessoensis]XP_021353130.1 NADP-dependent malic enzyme-like [Mizuhopecten yessoensis]XP_021353131.1 NADP-dependent malic enzyme-like [Mizuhopecten yessoensis]OWF50634.1 NADP-dependent malic enzyme [Mizuhopecten yessoensis]